MLSAFLFVVFILDTFIKINANVFIVSGRSSGLRAAAARMLAGNGAKVAIADVQDAAGVDLCSELGGSFVHCDLCDEVDAEAAVAAAVKICSLRGLINCAGIAPAAKTVCKEGGIRWRCFARPSTSS